MAETNSSCFFRACGAQGTLTAAPAGRNSGRSGRFCIYVDDSNDGVSHCSTIQKSVNDVGFSSNHAPIFWVVRAAWL